MLTLPPLVNWQLFQFVVTKVQKKTLLQMNLGTKGTSGTVKHRLDHRPQNEKATDHRVFSWEFFNCEAKG
jgi:hypothetical protein